MKFTILLFSILLISYVQSQSTGNPYPIVSVDYAYPVGPVYFNENYFLEIYGSGFNFVNNITINYLDLGSEYFNVNCSIYTISNSSILCRTVAPSYYGYSNLNLEVIVFSPYSSGYAGVFLNITCNCNPNYGYCLNGTCTNFTSSGMSTTSSSDNGSSVSSSSSNGGHGSSDSSVSSSSNDGSGSTSSEDELIICKFNRLNQTLSITNYGTESVEIVCTGSGNVNCYNNNFKCKSFDSYSEIQCSSFNEINCFANNTITCNAGNFKCII